MSIKLDSGITQVASGITDAIKKAGGHAIEQLKKPVTAIIEKLKIFSSPLNKSHNCITTRIVKFVGTGKDPIVKQLCNKLNLKGKDWEAFPNDLKNLLQKGIFDEQAFQKLGAGNFGSVYSVGTDGKYVIKISKNNASETNTDQLGNELVMSRIKGRDVGGLYTEGVDFVTKYYGTTEIETKEGKKSLSIFERADGVDGDKFLQSDAGKNLTFVQRLTIANQLAKSIATLHSVGLVHQDIKPENMQVYCQGNDLRVKLIDFGTVGTKTNGTLGTPMFSKLDKTNGTAGLKKDIKAYGASMLFNFFPEKETEINSFLNILNNARGKTNAIWLNFNDKPFLNGNISEEKICKKYGNDKIIYTPLTPSDEGLSINLDKIDSFIDFLNGEEGKKRYDAKEIIFLKEFFKQTLASETPSSMAQVSKALEDFNVGILDSGEISMEGIFNKASADNPKRIPEFLLKSVENAQAKLEHTHLIGKGKVQEALTEAKNELEDFKEQNPDYFDFKNLKLSEPEILRYRKLGIMSEGDLKELRRAYIKST